MVRMKLFAVWRRFRMDRGEHRGPGYWVRRFLLALAGAAALLGAVAAALFRLL